MRGRRVKVPLFEIVSNPVIKISDAQRIHLGIPPRGQKNLIIYNEPHIVRDSSTEFMGVFPVRQNIQVLPADGARKLKLGWTVSETIGIGIINPSGISRMGISRKPNNLIHAQDNMTIISNIPEPVEKNTPFNFSFSFVTNPVDPRAVIK